MQEKKNGRKMIIIALVIFAVVSAVLLGLSHLNIDGLNAKKTVIGDKGVSMKDITDENGKFIILDYPEYDVAKCVKLPDYKNFVAHVEPIPEVTDEDVNTNIESYIMYYQKFDRTEEGTVKSGDIVEITYSAYDDGQLVSSYSATDGIIILGESDEPVEFIEAFDGSKVGEMVEFDVSFDSDWADTSVQGHTLHFKGSVSALLTPMKLSDETVSTITDGKYETEAEFRSYIRDEIVAYDKATYENEIATQVSEFLTNESTFKTIPDSLIKWYVSIEMKYYQDMADNYGMSVKEYMANAGITEDLDQFIYLVSQECLPMVQRYVALLAVAEAEGITLDESNEEDASRIEKRYQEVIDGFGLEDKDAAERYYKKSNIYNDALNWKTLDWLMKNTKVEAPVETEEETESSSESIENVETELSSESIENGE